ncbi:TonB family protein [Cupriavidus sp. AU9028]|uniref:TonB family protein n=1 Tax=Cupriavidus sp. AU9028 TaxID=2871157 RepID=UPI001C96EC4A|nr:TonB family protein [Cupriavidus sp. AU9028]MBY4899217.1 energy transducer TonB [Cupriavidus sp. AU9028]
MSQAAAAALATLALAAPPAAAAEPDEPPADAQVRRVVQTFHGPAVRGRLIAAARDAGYTGASGQFGCVAAVQREEVVDALIPAVTATLGPDQLEQAGRFLDSPVGALLRWRAATPTERAGMTAPAAVPDAAQAWRDFAATETGATLATPPAAVQAAVSRFEREVLGRCGGMQGASAMTAARPGNLCVPPRPVYPASARREARTGAVEVWLMLDDAGKVASTAVYRSSGVAALDAAAETAVQAMQCKAYRDQQGAPAAAVALQRIEFKLAPD